MILHKWAFQFKFNRALRSLFTPAYWSNFKIRPRDKEKVYDAYVRQCKTLLHEIDPMSRRLVMEFLDLVAMEFHRENMKFLDKDQDLINRARMFQTIKIKQAIKASLKEKKELDDTKK